jgi:hypothetical protein
MASGVMRKAQGTHRAERAPNQKSRETKEIKNGSPITRQKSPMNH